MQFPKEFPMKFFFRVKKINREKIFEKKFSSLQKCSKKILNYSPCGLKIGICDPAKKKKTTELFTPPDINKLFT